MARPRASDIEGREQPTESGGGSVDPIAAALGAIDPSGDVGGSLSDTSGDDFTYDPERHLGPDRTNADGSYRRKRRRGDGGTARVGRKSKTSKSAPSVNAIESALTGIHALAAVALKTPELALDESESRPLAEAVAEVSKHYDIPGLSDKAIAWVGLVIVAGKLYAPRYVLVSQRLKAESAERRGPATVTHLKEVRRKEKPAPQPVEPTGHGDVGAYPAEFFEATEPS